MGNQNYHSAPEPQTWEQLELIFLCWTHTFFHWSDALPHWWSHDWSHALPHWSHGWSHALTYGVHVRSHPIHHWPYDQLYAGLTPSLTGPHTLLH